LTFVVELLYLFAAFVVGILFEEFLLEPILGPILRYRYKFLRKKIGKLISNPKVAVHVVSKSDDISELAINPEKLATILTEYLRKINVNAERQGHRILINSIKYGDIQAKGVIEMAVLPHKDGLLTRGFEVDIEAPCAYRRFSDHILELSRCAEQVKSVAITALGKPIQFLDFLKCNLNNLYEVTGILSDLKFDYMKLGGEVEVMLGAKDVNIAKLPFSVTAIDKLRVQHLVQRICKHICMTAPSKCYKKLPFTVNYYKLNILDAFSRINRALEIHHCPVHLIL
jgi:hypothetical protein